MIKILGRREYQVRAATAAGRCPNCAPHTHTLAPSVVEGRSPFFSLVKGVFHTRGRAMLFFFLTSTCAPCGLLAAQDRVGIMKKQKLTSGPTKCSFRRSLYVTVWIFILRQVRLRNDVTSNVGREAPLIKMMWHVTSPPAMIVGDVKAAQSIYWLGMKWN